LPFLEFAYNRSVHSTTEFSPFEIVCGFNPLTPMDLIPFPIDERVSLDGNRKAQVVKTLHDTIQERSNSDYDVKCATIQFYGNSHNSQSDRWIGLEFYMESPDMFSYLRLKFQINRCSGRH
jgi:hypothetical protein